jgi:hypothetical protein
VVGALPFDAAQLRGDGGRGFLAGSRPRCDAVDEYRAHGRVRGAELTNLAKQGKAEHDEQGDQDAAGQRRQDLQGIQLKTHFESPSAQLPQPACRPGEA